MHGTAYAPMGAESFSVPNAREDIYFKPKLARQLPESFRAVTVGRRRPVRRKARNDHCRETEVTRDTGKAKHTQAQPGEKDRVTFVVTTALKTLDMADDGRMERLLVLFSVRIRVLFVELQSPEAFVHVHAELRDRLVPHSDPDDDRDRELRRSHVPGGSRTRAVVASRPAAVGGAHYRHAAAAVLVVLLDRRHLRESRRAGRAAIGGFHLGKVRFARVRRCGAGVDQGGMGETSPGGVRRSRAGGVRRQSKQSIIAPLMKHSAPLGFR
ncbi:MAG: hypothetical protein BJ554DRAFT_6031 [Olpidium bornovanus]|uniref:Uncharacterized protein n=1 Tax=Olpidium bornovanus TaxID=278681 RepID=A0A8H7ZYK9_9FUNG|nr:MAG: hypothetical protein BJ554DRAFT_6031 [Olpidium bornovanus]